MEALVQRPSVTQSGGTPAHDVITHDVCEQVAAAAPVPTCDTVSADGPERVPRTARNAPLRPGLVGIRCLQPPQVQGIESTREKCWDDMVTRDMVRPKEPWEDANDDRTLARLWKVHNGSPDLQEVKGGCRVGRRRAARRTKVAKKWNPEEAHRCAFCGSPLRQSYVDTGVASGTLPPEAAENVLLRVGENPENGHRSASWSGIARCASVWACPTCSAKIRREKAYDIATGLGNFFSEEEPGTALFVTYTLSHHLGTRLADEIKALQVALRTVTGARAVRDCHKAFDYTGTISSWDFTYGERHGWHAHQHRIILFAKTLTHCEIEAYRQAIYAAYSAALERQGFHCDESHGVMVEKVRDEDLGTYISKASASEAFYGAASEVARSDAKQGRLGGLNPFAFLDHPGDKRFRTLWREYVRATKGLNAVRWSRGLRERLGVDADDADEKLLERDQRREVRTFAEVPRDVFAHVWWCAPSNLIRALEMAEQNDPAGVAAAFDCDYTIVRYPDGREVVRLWQTGKAWEERLRRGTPFDYMSPRWAEHKLTKLPDGKNYTMHLPDVGMNSATQAPFPIYRSGGGPAVRVRHVKLMPVCGRHEDEKPEPDETKPAYSTDEWLRATEGYVYSLEDFVNINLTGFIDVPAHKMREYYESVDGGGYPKDEPHIWGW